MLLEKPPQPFCPSMDVKTIGLFIRFKRLPEGTPLLDDDENPVLNVLGNEIHCQGGWNDPLNADQLMSAVRAVHISRGQVGAYMDTCDNCIEEVNQKTTNLAAPFTFVRRLFGVEVCQMSQHMRELC